MILPRVTNRRLKSFDGRHRTIFQQEFRGLNQNLRTDSGEFNDVRNVTLDDYPVIGSRQGLNEQYVFEGNVNGLHEFGDNKLMLFIGTDLIVITEEDGVTIYEDMFSDSEKSVATIGTMTVVMPDKYIIDTSGEKDGPIVRSVKEKNYTGYDLRVRTVPCDIEGETAWEKGNSVTESATAPATPNDGDWWYDMTNQIWKEYNADDNKWVEIELAYTKLIPVLTTTTDKYTRKNDPSEDAIQDLDDVRAFFELFDPLDTLGVYIFAGTIPLGVEWPDYTVYALTENNAINYTGITHTKDIVVNMKATTNIGKFRMKRKCPDLQHLVASNNRIWGIHQDDAFGIHEIMACKLGDPTQWYNYSGTSMDSYAVSLGSDAEITAGCEYNNYVHYFTEDKIIKIYGDYPSNYQVRGIPADGVLSGAHDTLVQVEGELFWVSPIGIVAYEGSLPYFRGQKFEPNFLNGASLAAGKDGTKYCLSVTKENAVYKTYTYDAKLGLWSCGIGSTFEKAAEYKNALCFLDDHQKSGRTKFCTLYERTRKKDRVFGNELMMPGYRTIGEHLYPYNELKYFAPVTMDSSYAFDEEHADEDSSVSVSDGEITVTALTDYRSGSTKLNSGAAYPVKVYPGNKLIVSYRVDDESHNRVNVSLRDKDDNPISESSYDVTHDNIWIYPDDSSPHETIYRTIITIPEGAAWAVVLFGSWNTLNAVTYSDVSAYEISEEDIMWDLKTGDLGLDTPNQKYISRVQLRIDLRGSLQIDMQYDNEDLWTNVYLDGSDHLKSITVPIKVKRCDHFKIRMSGFGRFHLYSMGYQLSEGSERCLL